MPLDDFVRDVQPNAKAGVGFLFWIADAIEAIEKVIGVLFLNPNAKILNAHYSRILCRGYPDDDRICLRRIFDGICQEIGERLTYAVFISPNGRSEERRVGKE